MRRSLDEHKRPSDKGEVVESPPTSSAGRFFFFFLFFFFFFLRPARDVGADFYDFPLSEPLGHHRRTFRQGETCGTGNGNTRACFVPSTEGGISLRAVLAWANEVLSTYFRQTCRTASTCPDPTEGGAYANAGHNLTC